MESKTDVAIKHLELAIDELVVAKIVFRDLKFESTAEHLVGKILELKDAVKFLRS